MIPSSQLNAAKPSLIIASKSPRTPSELLHRALAHVNHETFNVHRLTIFEDPAIAVLNVLPKPQDNQDNRGLRSLKNPFTKKNFGVLISLKVTAIDRNKKKFFVRYVLDEASASNRIKRPSQNDFPTGLGQFIEDIFSAMPDISFEKLRVNTNEHPSVSQDTV